MVRYLSREELAEVALIGEGIVSDCAEIRALVGDLYEENFGDDVRSVEFVGPKRARYHSPRETDAAFTTVMKHTERIIDTAKRVLRSQTRVLVIAVAQKIQNEAEKFKKYSS